MNPERRSAPRLRSYLPVRLRPSGGQLIETLTKDLSLGGFRCVVPSPLPVGSQVALELALPRGRDVLEMRGRTAWFRLLQDGEQFDLGVSFAEIPDETKRRLSSYIEQLATPSLVSRPQ